MIKNTKRTSIRICMCCGEKKEISVDESYCTDCSTVSGSSNSMLISSTPSKESTYSKKGIVGSTY